MTFTSLVDRVDDVVHRRLGEQAEIRPRLPARGVADPGPDPARLTFTVGLIVIAEPAEDIDAGGVRRKFVTHLASGRVIASVTRASLAGREVRVGDEVALVERSGAPSLTVARIHDRDLGVFTWELES